MTRSSFRGRSLCSNSSIKLRRNSKSKLLSSPVARSFYIIATFLVISTLLDLQGLLMTSTEKSLMNQWLRKENTLSSCLAVK